MNSEEKAYIFRFLLRLELFFLVVLAFAAAIVALDKGIEIGLKTFLYVFIAYQPILLLLYFQMKKKIRNSSNSDGQTYVSQESDT